MFIVKNQLSEIRKKHKFTQKDIADIIGVDRTTYTCYETGKTNPSFETLKYLAKVYNVLVDDFIEDDSEPSESHTDRASVVRVSQNNIFAQLSKEERTAVAYLRLLSSKDRAKMLEKMKQFTKEHTQGVNNDAGKIPDTQSSGQ